MRAILLIALLASSAASAQPAASVLSGQILSAAGDAPLRRARVQVLAGREPFDPVLTDDDGRFAVAVTGSGPFTVTVEKAGYVVARTTVSRDDLAVELVVRLPRGAAVSGTVVDQNGRATPLQLVNLRLMNADGVPAATSQTTADDRGEFRFAGLARGRYEVWAGLDPVTMTVLSSANAPVRVRIAGDAAAGVSPRQQVSVETGDDVAVQLSVTDNEAVIAQMLAERGGLALPRPSEVPPGTGVLSGRVIDESGQPIRNARLGLSRAGVDQPVRTSGDGRFSYSGIAAGEYMLEASAPGYANARYGQLRAGDAGRLIRIAAGEHLDGFEMILRRGPIISGVIVDEHGEPMQGARVRAVRLQYQGGRMTAGHMFAERRSDDRGYYRLAGLLPGTYVVSATVDAAVMGLPQRRPVAYAPVYYPGVPNIASAIPLDVNVDTVADLALTAAPGSVIVGAARDGQAPLVSGSAQLVETRRSTAISGLPREARIQSNGAFIFANVPPGEYVIQVIGDGPGRTGLFGTGVVSVSPAGEPVEVTIGTSYGTTLTGRITVEGPLETPTCVTAQLPGVSVQSQCGANWSPGASFTIAPVALDDGARASATFSTGGNGFMLSGLFGPTALALRRAPGDEWYLKSVRINGIDVTDSGLDFGPGGDTPGDTIEGVEIVVSRNGASITGKAATDTAAAADYVVVAFPPFRDEWAQPHSRRMKFTRARGDGSFRLAGLPAGDYLVAAVDRLEGSADGGDWQNPAVLELLAARAERVTLGEGQSRDLTLRLINR
jgi:protocatechuate 3,4-dioxygenase beta subunit